jgi:hypothetical protein
VRRLAGLGVLGRAALDVLAVDPDPVVRHPGGHPLGGALALEDSGAGCGSRAAIAASSRTSEAA